MNNFVSFKPPAHSYILVIETNDSLVDLVISTLCAEGYRTVFVNDIKEALLSMSLSAPPYQGVLLNLKSVDPSDYRLVKKLIHLAHKQKLPIIFSGEDESNQALVRSISFDPGCFYIESMTPEALIAAFGYPQACSNFQNEVNTPCPNPFKILPGLVSVKFRFKTTQEANTLTETIANIFPNPERVKQGLNELMLNAIEHGNLGISYFEKSLLLKQGIWLEELAKRSAMPANASRFVEMEVIYESDRITVMIKDQGQGFDWQKFMDFASEDLSELHGRGIAMARMLSFDSLEYLDGGRIAKACVLLPGNPVLKFF